MANSQFAENVYILNALANQLGFDVSRLVYDLVIIKENKVSIIAFTNKTLIGDINTN